MLDEITDLLTTYPVRAPATAKEEAMTMREKQ